MPSVLLMFGQSSPRAVDSLRASECDYMSEKLSKAGSGIVTNYCVHKSYSLVNRIPGFYHT